ncbi:unnamed protein product [Phytophthora fragariaefolia]|uniref:Unnamed protein product n=1 Tax=Phytophthora fragariaefolia TaxID=1490495 RepID=A0A9W6XA30_9STRA|nr:unnamed protein product [Phytophthora fragariaefolia]
MENHENNSDDNAKPTRSVEMVAGALRVNRKAQFGSSWDDSAIERKTLVSDMVGDGPQNVATTKPRSPSLTAKYVFATSRFDDNLACISSGSLTRKRVVKRPSSLTVSSSTAKLFAQRREDSAGRVLQVSTSSKDSDSDAFLELAATAATIADTSECRDKGEQSTEAPMASNAKGRKSKVAETTSGSASGGMAPLGNPNVLVAALTSLQAQVEILASEKTQLEAEVVTARTTIQNLEQKLAASEQSSDLIARQLNNVKESFQAKIMAREEEVSLEKMTLAKEKETQLQHQQARFSTEAELWKHEIAALTKVKLELESENDRLVGELNNEVGQRGFAEAKNRTLRAELDRTSEELQMLSQERERFERAQIEIVEIREKMASDLRHHELQSQQQEERVSALLLEREGQVARWERERQTCRQQHQAEKAKLLRFVQEVRGLHQLLHMSVTDAREHFHTEIKKTKDVLEVIQQQASEFAVHQSDREVALMSRKGRILQLETQLKNDRQMINQLEATLVKSTRVLEKKHETLKAKFQEQKEHLEITLAVRQGLTTDLQAKRKQVSELEREVARLTLAKGKTDVKLKHAQQQIQAMQKVHACEMEKFAKKTALAATGTGKIAQVQPAEPNPLEEIAAMLLTDEKGMITGFAESDELDFREGDVLRVLRVQDDGWWCGYNVETPHVIGLFPSNYVQAQHSRPPQQNAETLADTVTTPRPPASSRQRIQQQPRQAPDTPEVKDEDKVQELRSDFHGHVGAVLHLRRTLEEAERVSYAVRDARRQLRQRKSWRDRHQDEVDEEQRLDHDESVHARRHKLQETDIENGEDTEDDDDSAYPQQQGYMHESDEQETEKVGFGENAISDEENNADTDAGAEQVEPIVSTESVAATIIARCYRRRYAEKHEREQRTKQQMLSEVAAVCIQRWAGHAYSRRRMRRQRELERSTTRRRWKRENQAATEIQKWIRLRWASFWRRRVQIERESLTVHDADSSCAARKNGMATQQVRHCEELEKAKVVCHRRRVEDEEIQQRLVNQEQRQHLQLREEEDAQELLQKLQEDDEEPLQLQPKTLEKQVQRRFVEKEAQQCEGHDDIDPALPSPPPKPRRKVMKKEAVELIKTLVQQQLGDTLRHHDAKMDELQRMIVRLQTVVRKQTTMLENSTDQQVNMRTTQHEQKLHLPPRSNDTGNSSSLPRIGLHSIPRQPVAPSGIRAPRPVMLSKLPVLASTTKGTSSNQSKKL